jgi:hypothetical protein
MGSCLSYHSLLSKTALQKDRRFQKDIDKSTFITFVDAMLSFLRISCRIFLARRSLTVQNPIRVWAFLLFVDDQMIETFSLSLSFPVFRRTSQTVSLLAFA